MCGQYLPAMGLAGGVPIGVTAVSLLEGGH